MQPGSPLRFLTTHQAEARQAARVVIGSAAAYFAYRLFSLEQGYWAVLTVIIVLQGSIGGTLGAATDRLIGTIAGAVLGGAAAVLLPRDFWGTAGALAIVTAICAYGSALRPQLRVAPVTAAIMLLGQTTNLAPERFVLDRIIEIALGGLIGVGTSLFVFPARSRSVLVTRVGSVLGQFAGLMRDAAQSLTQGGVCDPMPHGALRRALGLVEAAMTDAERERSARLAEHGIPLAVPRALWRVRNDLVHITRGLERPLPTGVSALLAQPAAEFLQSCARYTDRALAALQGAKPVERGDMEEDYLRLTDAVMALRAARLTRDLEFEEVGRIFGLIFAFEQLHRNLADLADRIDEAAVAPTRRRAFSFWRRDQPAPPSSS